MASNSQPKTKQKAAKKPEQKPVKKKKAKKETTKLRGKAARLSFLVDVASASGQQMEDTRKFLEALSKATRRQLQEKGHVRIPEICHLWVRTLPARQEGSQTIMGRVCMIKASGETKKVAGSPARSLSTAMS